MPTNKQQTNCPHKTNNTVKAMTAENADMTPSHAHELTSMPAYDQTSSVPGLEQQPTNNNANDNSNDNINNNCTNMNDNERMNVLVCACVCLLCVLACLFVCL